MEDGLHLLPIATGVRPGTHKLSCSLAGAARGLLVLFRCGLECQLGSSVSCGSHGGDVLSRDRLDDVACPCDNTGGGELLEGTLCVPRGAHGCPDALLKLLVLLKGEGQLADLQGNLLLNQESGWHRQRPGPALWGCFHPTWTLTSVTPGPAQPLPHDALLPPALSLTFGKPQDS